MLAGLQKGYYLGVDTGATTTQATITDESGFVIAEAESGSANIHNVTLEMAFKNIIEAVKKARKIAGEKDEHISRETFEGACLGLSGMDSVPDRMMTAEYFNKIPLEDRTLNAKKLIVASNGLTGLMSGAENPYGVCLISATGSNCYGLSRIGKEATAGNWGYLLGDQGSAYALGRAVLRQVMKEYDGRSCKTGITEKVLDFLSLSDPSEIVSWAYNHGNLSVRDIASLSKICDEDSLPDVVEIAEMVNKAVKDLALAYKAVINRLGVDSNENIPVVLVGGLFKMKGQFTDKVKKSILNITPKANIIIQRRSISEGAALIARMHQQIKLFPESLVVIIKPS